jgi:hypothetical protein
MATFNLNYDRVLQGEFNLGELNLFFIFQVNCPGCFLYGFPQMQRLHHQYKSRGLKVLGISTAFEDFEYNTAANVELLLTERQTVGATKQAIGDWYEREISFPIACDRLTTGAELVTDDNINFLGNLVAQADRISPNIREQLQHQIALDLDRYQQTSATFTLNLLKGTPSFILTDRQLQILARWFGHESDANICSTIEQYLTDDRLYPSD